MSTDLIHVLFALAGAVLTYLVTRQPAAPAAPSAPGTPTTPTGPATLSIPQELLAAVQALLDLHQQATTAAGHTQLANLVNGVARPVLGTTATTTTTPDATRGTHPS